MAHKSILCKKISTTNADDNNETTSVTIARCSTGHIHVTKCCNS